MRGIAVIPRIYVNDLNSSLSFYKKLLNSEPEAVFHLNETSIARFENLLVIQSQDEKVKNVIATIVVNSITEAQQYINENGGQIISEIAQTPSGKKMIVRHQDGNSFEYIEPTFN